MAMCDKLSRTWLNSILFMASDFFQIKVKFNVKIPGWVAPFYNARYKNVMFSIKLPVQELNQCNLYMSGFSAQSEVLSMTDFPPRETLDKYENQAVFPTFNACSFSTDYVMFLCDKTMQIFFFC